MRVLSINSLANYNNKKEVASLNNKSNTSFKSYKNYNIAFNEIWNTKFLAGQPEKNFKLFDMLDKLFRELVLEKSIGMYHKFMSVDGEVLYNKLVASRVRSVKNSPQQPLIVSFLDAWDSHKLSCESEKGKTIFMACSKPGVYYYSIKSKNSFQQDPITKTKPLKAFCFSSLDEDDDRMIILSTPYHGQFALTRGRLTKGSTNDLREHPYMLAEVDKNLKLNIDDGLVEFITDTGSNKLRIKAKGNRGFLCKTRYEGYNYDLKANSVAMSKLDYDYWPKITYDDDIPDITDKNLLKCENILKNEQVKKIKYGKDYILLVLQKDSEYADFEKCIMPFSYSDKYYKDWGYDERNRMLGSTFDSKKLYFTPIVPNSNYKINEDDIIIAAKKENVVVFNKNLRDREFILDPVQKEKCERTSNFTPYLTSTYTINETNKLLSENNEGFSPEVIFGLDAISKNDFITPKDARSILSEQNDYSFEGDDRKNWKKSEFIDNSFKVENDCLNFGGYSEYQKGINENTILANVLKGLVKFNK